VEPVATDPEYRRLGLGWAGLLCWKASAIVAGWEQLLRLSGLIRLSIKRSDSRRFAIKSAG
jgi:hypothetical protein